MTLRARIAAVASLSVALAVLAAAIGLYVAVRSDLRGEVDHGLRERAQAFRCRPARCLVAARAVRRPSRPRSSPAPADLSPPRPPSGERAGGGPAADRRTRSRCGSAGARAPSPAAVAGGERAVSRRDRARALRGGVGLRPVHLARRARCAVPGGQGASPARSREHVARPGDRGAAGAAARSPTGA